ncbi:MAG: hypothetical protein F4Y27_12230 [Acidimicrobiaceae bacterium]|nr:hypothetical protein [Acidimicrobiaceae bacterium]MXW60421.1 hypothetical protein [Acidimicrobiaceae bacterium]MXW74651.1 hypothetical protein [Acidimicrobiaceae bacterium]MYA75430.1 hypothetical protein [Acidimicrobiaceae bacterium]MYC41376.1 hypothetical protein [Acidimicrobiaceae bacterium]
MTDTSDQTDPPSDFDTFTRRFADAATALEELRDQIGILSDLKEQQNQATDELNESNAALHAAVEALSPVGELGAELLSTLKATVATAGIILDQNTIEAIRKDITELSKEVEQLRDGIREERDEARKELEELQTKLQALPERVRNKHGLS